jgi:hypothetical protein
MKLLDPAGGNYFIEVDASIDLIHSLKNQFSDFDIYITDYQTGTLLLDFPEESVTARMVIGYLKLLETK